MIPHDRMKHNLLATLRQVLRSLVRIALKNNVIHGDFANELRAAYLEVARDMAREYGREPSEARLRLMTGLPSSDIHWTKHQLEDEGRSSDGARADLHTIAATVLSAWHSEADFAMLYGVPIELPLTAERGQRSFAELVARIDRTADAEVVLERLVDAGCIREVAPGRYAAKSRVYMARELSIEGLQYFGDIAGRMIDTLAHNLMAGNAAEEKQLERVVFADHGLPVSRLREFQDRAKDAWDNFGTPLDNWLNAPMPQGDLEDEPVVQTGVGIYQYVIRPRAERPATEKSGEWEGIENEVKPS